MDETKLKRMILIKIYYCILWMHVPTFPVLLLNFMVVLFVESNQFLRQRKLHNHFECMWLYNIRFMFSIFQVSMSMKKSNYLFLVWSIIIILSEYKCISLKIFFECRWQLVQAMASTQQGLENLVMSNSIFFWRSRFTLFSIRTIL